MRIYTEAPETDMTPQLLEVGRELAGSRPRIADD
jgi:hypothetical protein